ncbi:hypothetical protein X777_01275, partial [Ooceraea biroi]
PFARNNLGPRDQSSLRPTYTRRANSSLIPVTVSPNHRQSRYPPRFRTFARSLALPDFPNKAPELLITASGLNPAERDETQRRRKSRMDRRNTQILGVRTQDADTLHSLASCSRQPDGRGRY